MLIEHDIKQYDRIVIGGGLYGLYAALRCGRRGERVCVLEKHEEVFSRATYVNQARVHLGYHYPRSLGTALKCAHYFERFHEEFGFCINGSFEKVYATSARLGWTTADEFVRFCECAGIPCEPISPARYFNPLECDGCFVTREDSYDAQLLKAWFLEEIGGLNSVDVLCLHPLSAIEKVDERWVVRAAGDAFSAPFILNAAYAGVNEAHALIGADPFDIKYELCEVILCKPSEALRNVGLTVMDGPFFSVMPFGFTGFHSLTSVTFTPHATCAESPPHFPCMDRFPECCEPNSLGNCNTCSARPTSAWPSMSALARKYLRPEFKLEYVKSLYSMKPLSRASEVDDSRPTLIRKISGNPTFLSVLSGKVSTVFDLDPYLDMPLGVA